MERGARQGGAHIIETSPSCRRSAFSEICAYERKQARQFVPLQQNDRMGAIGDMSSVPR